MKSPVNLSKKAFSGIFVFLVGLTLFIFLPAWDLFYWQGYLYLTVFSISVLLITFYFLKHDPKLIERRLNAGPTAEKDANQKVIQLFTGIALILLFVFSGFDHRLGLSSVSAFVVLLSNAVVLAGFVIVFLTFKVNSHASAIIEVEKNQKVISSGPYSVVRHPMYAGAVLLLFFTPLALGSVLGVVFVIPVIFGIVQRLLEEEKLLLRKLYGYAKYYRKTKFRLIPFIW
jgi:protein-S-isoprenylcysteine O-methyltransferase Ste14